MSKAIVATAALLVLGALATPAAQAQIGFWPYGGWGPWSTNWQGTVTTGNPTPYGLANQGTYYFGSNQTLGTGQAGGYGYYNQNGEYNFSFPQGSGGSLNAPGYASIPGFSWY